MNDALLLLALGGMHLVAIGAGVGLIVLALREDPDDGWHEQGDDGGSPVRPPERPRGGPPLPGSDPSRVRLRGPDRLADGYRQRPRRGPVEEPRRGAPARATRRARSARARPRGPARGTPR